MPNPRANRVAERIHEIVASLVTNRLKDPRLELVTVTDVRVTGDLQHATVFYTAYGDERRLRDAGRALNAAKGNIRSHVGRQLGLRLTPTIEFTADALPETARSLEDALAAARHRDAEIAKSAEGAAPAGDADPYKKPRDVEEGEAADEASADADDASDGDALESGEAFEASFESSENDQAEGVDEA